MKDLTISERRVVVLAAVLAAAIGPLPVVAQVKTNVPDVVAGARPAIVERIKIHGTALEGNLEGDAVDRDAIVFLPPSYHQNRTRRYPVVYALHGYSIGAEQWTKEIHVPQTIEGAFAKGAHEMIVVLPDSKTVHNGSMYSSSVTTGDFENYVARDVVSYIDAHYRTIATRDSRGLVGHSMGGYGATRIGMKHADVFGSLYIMSPCCLSPRGPAAVAALRAATTRRTRRRWRRSKPQRTRRSCRSACARSWRRRRPGRRTRRTRRSISICRSVTRQQAVLAKWAANAPLAFIDQYVPAAAPVSRDRDRRRRPGRPAGRRRQAARHARSVRHREHVRDLPGDAHQRRRRALSGARDAVLQPDAVVRAGEAITWFCLAATRPVMTRKLFIPLLLSSP